MELEGIEPSSKRGMNMLSTCLALLQIFVVLLRERQPKRYPYSMIKISQSPHGKSDAEPRYTCVALLKELRSKSLGQRLVRTYRLRLSKLTYYTSVRQRERNYFRQLKNSMLDIQVREQQLTTCLPTPSSRCQSHVSPIYGMLLPLQNKQDRKRMKGTLSPQCLDKCTTNLLCSQKNHFSSIRKKCIKKYANEVF